MFIIINTVLFFLFFANVNLEAVPSLCAILFSCACVLFRLVAFCDEKKEFTKIKWHFSA